MAMERCSLLLLCLMGLLLVPVSSHSHQGTLETPVQSSDNISDDPQENLGLPQHQEQLFACHPHSWCLPLELCPREMVHPNGKSDKILCGQTPETIQHACCVTQERLPQNFIADSFFWYYGQEQPDVRFVLPWQPEIGQNQKVRNAVTQDVNETPSLGNLVETPEDILDVMYTPRSKMSEGVPHRVHICPLFPRSACVHWTLCSPRRVVFDALYDNTELFLCGETIDSANYVCCYGFPQNVQANGPARQTHHSYQQTPPINSFNAFSTLQQSYNVPSSRRQKYDSISPSFHRKEHRPQSAIKQRESEATHSVVYLGEDDDEILRNEAGDNLDTAEKSTNTFPEADQNDSDEAESLLVKTTKLLKGLDEEVKTRLRKRRDLTSRGFALDSVIDAGISFGNKRQSADEGEIGSNSADSNVVVDIDDQYQPFLKKIISDARVRFESKQTVNTKEPEINTDTVSSRPLNKDSFQSPLSFLTGGSIESEESPDIPESSESVFTELSQPKIQHSIPSIHRQPSTPDSPPNIPSVPILPPSGDQPFPSIRPFRPPQPKPGETFPVNPIIAPADQLFPDLPTGHGESQFFQENQEEQSSSQSTSSQLSPSGPNSIPFGSLQGTGRFSDAASEVQRDFQATPESQSFPAAPEDIKPSPAEIWTGNATDDLLERTADDAYSGSFLETTYHPDYQGIGDRYHQSESCGKSRSIGPLARITGGSERDGRTAFAEYPWHVAILSGDELSYQCAGVLVDPHVVLTVAHCVVGSTRRLLVRIGDWDLSSNEEFFPSYDVAIDRVFIHPDYYGGNLQNDIAALVLTPPVRGLPNVSPVCLPHPSHDFTHQNCWVAGWGQTAAVSEGYDGVRTYSWILKEAQLTVVDQKECESALRHTQLGPFYKLPKRGALCAAGYHGSDSCFGDGGGALVCRLPGSSKNSSFFVAGLVSWGIGCGQDIPAVYTKTSDYLPWIQNIIRHQYRQQGYRGYIGQYARAKQN